MEKIRHFLLVDDDRTSILINRLTIRKFNRDASVTSFTCPKEALWTIEKNYIPHGDQGTVLLLDLNMPSMSGWEFLREFEKFHSSVQQHFIIYILTSAVGDFSDKQEKFPCVKGFLTKPLNLKILSDMNPDGS